MTESPTKFTVTPVFYIFYERGWGKERVRVSVERSFKSYSFDYFHFTFTFILFHGFIFSFNRFVKVSICISGKTKLISLLVFHKIACILKFLCRLGHCASKPIQQFHEDLKFFGILCAKFLDFRYS